MRTSMILLMAALLIMGGFGCLTSADSEPEKGIAVKGLSVQGAIITKCEGKDRLFRKKCEFCGYLSPEEQEGVFNPAPWKMESKFACIECGKRCDVIMERK